MRVRTVTQNVYKSLYCVTLCVATFCFDVTQALLIESSDRDDCPGGKSNFKVTRRKEKVICELKLILSF